jgi:hypothetical protein
MQVSAVNLLFNFLFSWLLKTRSGQNNCCYIRNTNTKDVSFSIWQMPIKSKSLTSFLLLLFSTTSLTDCFSSCHYLLHFLPRLLLFRPRLLFLPLLFSLGLSCSSSCFYCFLSASAPPLPATFASLLVSTAPLSVTSASLPASTAPFPAASLPAFYHSSPSCPLFLPLYCSSSGLNCFSSGLNCLSSPCLYCSSSCLYSSYPETIVLLLLAFCSIVQFFLFSSSALYAVPSSFCFSLPLLPLFLPLLLLIKLVSLHLLVSVAFILYCFSSGCGSGLCIWASRIRIR